MKYLFAFFTAFITISNCFSQSYMTAGGIRVGTDWGVTLQQRLTKNTTIEGILQSSLQREEVVITGLYERHYPLVFRGLNIYTGAGLHKGWIQNDNISEAGSTNYKNPFGLTGIAGAELTIGKINVSYDFKPAVNIVGGEKKIYTQTGVSVRYVFLNNKVYKKKQKAKRKKNRQENGKGIRINEDLKFWKKKD